jgi:hypothetical protein
VLDAHGDEPDAGRRASGAEAVARSRGREEKEAEGGAEVGPARDVYAAHSMI